ncbi:DUF934 domain-containing protein [Psychrobacter sp. DM4]|uniref:DUF934 domain-containing protein n=1 Tax=Psychrobacter sp. DM4 TaxID=3440637 RepID=UPI003F4FA457
MANHNVLNSQGADISEQDSWQALTTDTLPDGVALTEIALTELLNKQEKIDLLLPLADLLDASGELAGGLLQQVYNLLNQQTSRLGVWMTSDTDADKLAGLSEFLLTQDLIVIHVPAFTDGRGFSYAHTLRQLGYTGEIRIAGEFGRDQIAYLLRSGIDSFVLNEHDLQSDFDIAQAFTALASSYDGRDASALPMFAAS